MVDRCWFHYCKAIQRKARKLKLSKLLRTNRNAKIIQKSMMSLPLLPADRFEEGYESIKVFARKKNYSIALKPYSATFKGIGSIRLVHHQNSIFEDFRRP